MAVAELSDHAAFRSFVDEHPVVLVDVYANWCGPCKAMAPTLDAFAGERDDVRVGKVNVDECPETAVELAVRSVPTIVVFVDGVEQRRHVGAASASQLAALVDGS